MATSVQSFQPGEVPVGLLARAKNYFRLPLSHTEESTLLEDRKEKDANRVNTLGQLAQNSATAYEFIQPKKPTIKALVIEFIKSRGLRGATTEEVLEAYPNIKFQSLAPRVTELHQAGITVQYGTRQTRSGLDAVVWVLNQEIAV